MKSLMRALSFQRTRIASVWANAMTGYPWHILLIRDKIEPQAEVLSPSVRFVAGFRLCGSPGQDLKHGTYDRTDQWSCTDVPIGVSHLRPCNDNYVYESCMWQLMIMSRCDRSWMGISIMTYGALAPLLYDAVAYEMSRCVHVCLIDWNRHSRHFKSLAPTLFLYTAIVQHLCKLFSCTAVCEFPVPIITSLNHLIHPLSSLIYELHSLLLPTIGTHQSEISWSLWEPRPERIQLLIAHMWMGSASKSSSQYTLNLDHWVISEHQDLCRLTSQIWPLSQKDLQKWILAARVISNPTNLYEYKYRDKRDIVLQENEIFFTHTTYSCQRLLTFFGQTKVLGLLRKTYPMSIRHVTYSTREVLNVFFRLLLFRMKIRL